MERVSFEHIVTTVCEVYGYRLEDIYRKPFKEGGLTQGQIEVLFEDYQKRYYDRMVFEAACHGVDLKKGAGKQEGRREVETSSVFEFKSPEEYEKMPKEEREKLTRQMMGEHKIKFG